MKFDRQVVEFLLSSQLKIAQPVTQIYSLIDQNLPFMLSKSALDFIATYLSLFTRIYTLNVINIARTIIKNK